LRDDVHFLLRCQVWKIRRFGVSGHAVTIRTDLQRKRFARNIRVGGIARARFVCATDREVLKNAVSGTQFQLG
jgi:hypothetical protein